MAGRLEGKVALITGGCSGIGLGAVELFLAEGARVVAADLQDAKGAMLEQRFAGKLRYIHCDVTLEAEIAAACALATEAFGGLDILFNNAGHAGMPGGVETLTAEGWDAIFAVLVRGPALGMKHARPAMVVLFRLVDHQHRFDRWPASGWGPSGRLHLRKAAVTVST